MLTEAQQKYLLTIPKEKTVTIRPFSDEIERTADEIIKVAHSAVPHLEIRHMGASALGLSGQGDLDIYILSPPIEFKKYLGPLIGVFGEPIKRNKTSIEWVFEKNSFPVELYLTDPSSEAMQEQIKIFEVLRDNKKLRTEYELLKERLSGQSLRDYQAAKYEFYNKVLS